MPVRKTRMMPDSAARSETCGRPPFGFSGLGGRSGSTTAQRSSGTRASMPSQPARMGFVPRSYSVGPTLERATTTVVQRIRSSRLKTRLRCNFYYWNGSPIVVTILRWRQCLTRSTFFMAETKDQREIVLRNLATHAGSARSRMCMSLDNAARLVHLTPELIATVENGSDCSSSLAELMRLALFLGLTELGEPRPRALGAV
jgi:hypothetical protein